MSNDKPNQKPEESKPATSQDASTEGKDMTQQQTNQGVAPRVFGNRAPTPEEQATDPTAAATQPKLDEPSGVAVPGDLQQQQDLLRITAEANLAKQESGAIHTGASNSTSSFKMSDQMKEVVMPESQAGYYSMQAGSVKGKGGKRVKGISTNRGFFYPDDVDSEAKKALDSLVERGYAYVSKSSTK